jgi:hypothetical protein
LLPPSTYSHFFFLTYSFLLLLSSFPLHISLHPPAFSLYNSPLTLSTPLPLCVASLSPFLISFSYLSLVSPFRVSLSYLPFSLLPCVQREPLTGDSRPLRGVPLPSLRLFF